MSKRKKQKVPHKGRTAARHSGARQIPHPHEHFAMARGHARYSDPTDRDNDGDIDSMTGGDLDAGPSGPSMGP